MQLTPAKNESNDHMLKVKEQVEKLTIDEQLQLAAAGISGTLESKLASVAVATVVARIVQLDQNDQTDLLECVKDLRTIKTQEDAEETLSTILEILNPNRNRSSLIMDHDVEKPSRETYEGWLVWISRQIKTLRDERGWTQQELADNTGLPQSHISRLEQGKHSPSHKTLAKIADACGVDVGTLTLE